MARIRSTPLRLLLIVGALVLLAMRACDRSSDSAPPSQPAPADTASVQGSDAIILDAFERRQSDLWVESGGVVDRLLADDNDGSRHQRFILRLSSGHTLLISHNIDLAPRLDGLRQGDTVRFRGEYEWNAQGGVGHWTHHDPDGRLDGGWLEFEGRRFR